VPVDRVVKRVLEGVRQTAGAARSVWDSGFLRPVRPDRAARMLFPYARFGATPATAGALAALRFPNRTAVIDERGTVTYAELDRRAAALATAFRHLDGEITRVGIMCRNHRGFVEAALAASRAGYDAVFLNTDFSAPQLDAVLEREGAGIVVADAEFDEMLDRTGFSGARVTAWVDGPSRHPTIDELVDSTTPERLVADHTAKMIILTSGTTGTPKGAQHDVSIGALVPAALTHAIRVPLKSGDPIVVAPPIFHTLGLAYLMNGLAMGMPIVLNRRFDAVEALRAVERHQAGALVVVPVMLSRLLEIPAGERPGTGCLRAVVCAGSALHAEVATAFMDSFGDILRNVYGATETGWATIATPEDLRKAPGTVGKPALGLTIEILNEDGEEVPRGEVGEIFMGGGLKFAGYTGGGGKTVRNGLTSTGNLGHFDDEGRLFVDGRADDMIVSGGENVFPAEVEELLEGHPAVAEVAVVGVQDEKFGQRLAAHVVRAQPSDGQPDEQLAEELKAYVKDRLARYKVPRDVVFTDALPRTSTGKIQHGRL